MTTLTLTAADAVRVRAGVRGGSSRPAALRLTRRGRALLLLLAFAVVLGGTLVATSADAGAPAVAPQVERYVVAEGDTLWAIAAGLARPGEDIRDVVREIELLNRLPSAGLIAGQQIVLPVDR